MPRLRRAKAPGAPPDSADRVYVLSRVTLGADVAVTSVMLDAAKRRYPDAEIVSSGRGKLRTVRSRSADPAFCCALPAVELAADRLAASAALWLDDGIVIDPDSRLSQLGLIRSATTTIISSSTAAAMEAKAMDRLPDLAARWAQEVFGVEEAASRTSRPCRAAGPPADITVSLGVGENAAQANRRRFRTRTCCRCWPRRERRSWWTRAAARKSASASRARCHRGCGRMTERSRPSPPRSRAASFRRLRFGRRPCGIGLRSVRHQHRQGLRERAHGRRWRADGVVISKPSAGRSRRSSREALTCTFRR